VASWTFARVTARRVPTRAPATQAWRHFAFVHICSPPSHRITHYCTTPTRYYLPVHTCVSRDVSYPSLHLHTKLPGTFSHSPSPHTPRIMAHSSMSATRKKTTRTVLGAHVLRLNAIDTVPTQRIPDSSKAYPWLHLHVKPPIVFLHRPLLHMPGNSVHSLMSLRSANPGPCNTPVVYACPFRSSNRTDTDLRTQLSERGRATPRTTLAPARGYVRAAAPRFPDGRTTANAFRVQPVQWIRAGSVFEIRIAFLLSDVQANRP